MFPVLSNDTKGKVELCETSAHLLFPVLSERERRERRGPDPGGERPAAGDLRGRGGGVMQVPDCDGRISGPTSPTEVVHLSKFAGFNQEN